VLSYFELPHYIHEPITAVLFAVVLGCVVTTPPGARPSRFVRLLERRPLVVAGTISYSAFLWSFPATEFLAQHRLVLTSGALWQVPVDFAIVTAVVMGLAAITYLLVERPALGLRRRARKAPAPIPAALTVETG
jgi:peptidoglycan/LPS O-acetylase OafA/YrhL